MDEVVVSRLLSEIEQSHPTRRVLIEDLEKKLQRSILTYFTSMLHPVIIEDIDNDMIEGMLQTLDPNKGITMILNSPGGSSLAAERIINTCRTYSHGDFDVIVPRMAKSAATMICMGANKILMPKTAELGPVDPQVVIITREGSRELRGAHYLIESYEQLFNSAVTTTGNIQPYLQQLDRYDSRDIREYKKMIELGEDIAVRSLYGSMMKTLSVDEIRNKIQRFLNPSETKSHGRPIYLQEAKESGLNVEEIKIDNDTWPVLWELYLRSNHLVNSPKVCKLCETVAESFVVPAPKYED
jgi:hypothetical protein